MKKINYIKSYQNGSLLNRLNTVDESDGVKYKVYDQTMMNEDLGVYQTGEHHPTTLYLKEDNNANYIYKNQVVVNMVNSQAALVGEKHSGTILPYNYTQIVLDTNKVYPAYFVYWFNESSESLKQLNLFKQGGSLIKKITAKQLKQMTITLPPYKKQKLIGDIAEKRRYLNYLREKRGKLMDLYLKEKLLGGTMDVNN